MEATKVALPHHVPPACSAHLAPQVPQHAIRSPKRKMPAQQPLPQPGMPGPAPRPPQATQNPANSESPRGGRDHDHRPTVVHVSGFPPYTQTHDIEQAFSRIGAVQVDKIVNKVAVLSFANAEDAEKALQHSKKVSVYGELVTVTTTSPKHRDNRSRMHTPRKDNKMKADVLDPKNIDLSGSFLEQVACVLGAVRLTQQEIFQLHALYADVEAALKEEWKECEAVPFGSITTGLGVKWSDADCFARRAGAGPEDALCVARARRVLQRRAHFADVLAIPRANTPIVKFLHVPTATACDLTFKTPLGVQNSRLVAFLLHADPRLVPVAVVVKYWAKVHGLSGTGKLSNYALTLMLLFFLQRPPALLPPVLALQRAPADDVLVDGWNAGFACRPDALPRSFNSLSIADLLGGFFDFYATFDFDDAVVCPFLGCPIKKKAFREPAELPGEFWRYRDNVAERVAKPFKWTTSICVQDPFEHSHNVASAVSSRMAAEIKAYFKFAAKAYEKEKPNDCLEFLRKILIDKPKIIRARTHPEYRVNLFPRIIVNIIDPDWKSVVREVVLTIFEQMLKLKLGKVEEKVNPDSRKEKEKYMGELTRAIWKRKQYMKLSHMMKVEFQQKEQKITEEILNTDKQAISIQFQLTVTYCHEPKSAVVSVKMSNGDVEAFKDFGKFYISVMQDWFVALMKPYSRPVENNTAAKIAQTILAPKAKLDAAANPNEDAPPARVSAPIRAQDGAPPARASAPTRAQDGAPPARASVSTRAQDSAPPARASAPTQAQDGAPPARSSVPTRAQDGAPPARASVPTRAQDGAPPARAQDGAEQ